MEDLENLEDLKELEKECEKEPADTTNETNDTNLFDQIKEEYENKLKSIILLKDKEIEKRDKVIKELISGNQSEKPKSDIELIIDNINEERKQQFKY